MVEELTTIENREPEERSPFNPLAIVLVILLLAALAWWVFAGQNQPSKNTETTYPTPTTTNSSTPSGTQP